MALTQQQRNMAALIMRLGAQAGLPRNRQIELVAAAYVESGLDPRIYNRAGSGAGGLFQLLSSGYVNRAKQLGGVLNPTANTKAILPDYVRYWKQHPNAAPGEAGRDVEISGMGADFYSKAIPMFGGVTPADAATAVPKPPRSKLPKLPSTAPGAAPNMGFGPQTIQQFDPGMLSQGIFRDLLEGDTPNVADLVPLSYKTTTIPGLSIPSTKKRQPPGSTGPEPVSDASPPPDKTTTTVTPKNVSKWAVPGNGMDRSGMKTNPAVFKAVARVAMIYGKPLTIGTGSNHREYVSGQSNRSDHWFGEAADIPMTGDELTKLGQDALIMAGMDPTEARKQTGGVFNVGGYNILFNTHVGGNHFNHLHIGMGRIIGRPV